MATVKIGVVDVLTPERMILVGLLAGGMDGPDGGSGAGMIGGSGGVGDTGVSLWTTPATDGATGGVMMATASGVGVGET